MQRLRLALITMVALLGTLVTAAQAQDFDTKAKFAVLMDYESGTLLFHKRLGSSRPASGPG